ncbi:MAG: crossover junction endodeoxyribonuclease RuvC [Gammaproteobacteria bacterium]
MIRILGIDPGSRVTGFGVVGVERHRVQHLAHGCIRLGDGAIDARLVKIFDTLAALIAEHRPHEAAIEKVFMNRNADSALKLGHARGVAMLAAGKAGLAVTEYSPNSIKQAVVGRGHAEKGQVQHMVRALLGLDGVLQADAADALAAAVCHAHMREGLARLARAGARA